MELDSNPLDNVPALLELRWSSLGTNKVVGSCDDMRKRSLDMAALGIASSEERGVQAKQDPRPTLEQDGRKEHPNPQADLKVGDNGHREVVVFLDKVSDLIGQGAVDLGSSSALGGRRRGREDGN